MNRYRALYLLTWLVVTAVNLAIISGLLLAGRQYRIIPTSQVTWARDSVSGTDGGQGWLQGWLKSGTDNQRPVILRIASREEFTAEKLRLVNGNVALFEGLFSQFQDDAYQRKRLEDLLQVQYSGWSGGSYEDLSATQDVPEKMIHLYEKQSGQRWNFFGEGILLASQEQVIVLRKGIDYTGTMQLKTGDGTFPFWGVFEIVNGAAQDGPRFEIPLTAGGKTHLEEAKLPENFPALIRVQRNLFEGYYIAGDMGNYQPTVPNNLVYISWLMAHKWIYTPFSNEEVFWCWYVPTIEQIVQSAAQRIASQQPVVQAQAATRSRVFFTRGRQIMVRDGQGERPFYIKGINLGPALPGMYFTSAPEEKETYTAWFSQMSALHINTLRVYTLLPPGFYQALYEYNRRRESAALAPLWLIQEIWPEEHPPRDDYLDADYDHAFGREIEYAVDAIHGNAQVPERTGRASGLYSYDVSPWLLGYLVGREMEPAEVLATDRLHKGYRFSGRYLKSEGNASPTEAWLAASCDAAYTRELEKYGNRPLISIVNWPTLDPMRHENEWNSLLPGEVRQPFNDSATVNIDHIALVDPAVGFFGSYHIYPNYPDFMNNQLSYAQYSDSQGTFRYGGYLRDLFQTSVRYPMVVAEYGISSSAAAAYLNPDGLNHGGLSELQQGQFLVRMTEAIRREGYSGSIVFEWMDEWVKRTWSTAPYMIPYDRHVLWHNMLDPEQNYGLLANITTPATLRTVFTDPSRQLQIQQVQMGQNGSWLEITLTGQEPWGDVRSLTGLIDTYSVHGESSPVYEFLMRLGSDSQPRILVNPGYNWLEGHYSSVTAGLEQYQPLLMTSNRAAKDETGTDIPMKTQELGLLKVGNFSDPHAMVWYERQVLHIRIPYGLLGMSDPSSRSVLYDPRAFFTPEQDVIGIRRSPTIHLQFRQPGQPALELRYTLQGWESPDFSSRIKAGVELLSQEFAQIGD